jgi:hypothetical protein
MSVARQVEMAYDLKILGEVAREAGFLTRVGGANGWYGVMEGAANCDLVITSRKHRFDMGFVKQPDGKVKMFADFHGGYVQKEMAEILIPRYLERATKGRMRVVSQQNTARTVSLQLERR